MKQWLENEIEKCKREMQHAAEMHFMTKYTAQAARKKALEECLEQLLGCIA
jgi:hypothetical protein